MESDRNWEELRAPLRSTRWLSVCQEEMHLSAEFPEHTRVRLMMGDTDAIKSYVFETSALPEIRGGSQILTSLEEQIRQIFRQKLGNDDKYLIYCGGGGFLAVVPDDQADEIKKRIERLYYERTTLATITIIYTEPVEYGALSAGLPTGNPIVDLDKLQARSLAAELMASHFDVFSNRRSERKHFGEWVSKLVAPMQQTKRQKTIAPFVEALPIHRRCDACGKRPSAHYDELRGEEICFICWQKRQQGRHERHDLIQNFNDWLRKHGNSEPFLKPAADLPEMIAGEGRIGLLYADGNNMGELLQQARSPRDYRHFSQTLSSVMRDVVYGSITECVRPLHVGQSNSARFEIVAIGGDDAILILPLSCAWNVAAELVRRFEEDERIKNLKSEFNDSGRRPVCLTMSAGIAMADVKYPIGFLRNLAEGLLKEAKRWARKTQTGSLCHLWLRSPVISEDARSLVRSLYHKKIGACLCSLTARPYTWEEAKHLHSLAKQLSQLPKSQRRALAESLEKGVLVSVNYALYQSARHPRYQLSALFGQLGELVKKRLAATTQVNWFWAEEDAAGSRWQTALLDALELVEMGAC